MNNTNPEEPDQRVGRNLQALRRQAGVSQTDLASALADRGLPFRQQTVAKTEAGTRQLRFHEAVAIAEVLGIETDELWMLPEERDATMIVQEQIDRVRRALRQVADASARYEAERQELWLVAGMPSCRRAAPLKVADAARALKVDLGSMVGEWSRRSIAVWAAERGFSIDDGYPAWPGLREAEDGVDPEA